MLSRPERKTELGCRPSPQKWSRLRAWERAPRDRIVHLHHHISYNLSQRDKPPRSRVWEGRLHIRLHDPRNLSVRRPHRYCRRHRYPQNMLPHRSEARAPTGLRPVSGSRRMAHLALWLVCLHVRTWRRHRSRACNANATDRTPASWRRKIDWFLGAFSARPAASSLGRWGNLTGRHTA